MADVNVKQRKAKGNSIMGKVRLVFFLAYQTSFSAIFTSADKPYLTYPYPIRGMDKKRITTRDVNTLVVLEVT